MKTELLAPAGDLDKLKIALDYGADAVYIGGKQFSLRARASNFTVEDIEQACIYAHNLNKKVYVTLNIIPHDEDFDKLVEYIKVLEHVNVDAVICASPSIVKTVKDNSNLEIHISTQTSITNSEAINYYRSLGANRVVLAREITLAELKVISSKSPIEIECFIHGGMCVSYSGRCMLSNNMTDRDANRGGCAHSCRWNYDLYSDTGIKITNNKSKFTMSSKDMQAIDYVFDLLDLNVHSLKIEGRMKSVHYIATVVSVYRKMIDDYYNDNIRNINFYKNEIKKAENRLSSDGYYKGETNVNDQLYNMRAEKPNKLFCGFVLEYDDNTNIVTIEQRNYFTTNDKFELVSPLRENVEFTIDLLYDIHNNEVEIARHPKEVLKFKSTIRFKKNDIIRIIR